MTEKEIELLGFKKELEGGTICEDKYGNTWTEESFYYYTYDITKGLTFITPADTEVVDGKWYVEFFNTEESVKFYDFEQVQKLINLLETAKNNSK